MVEKLKVDRCFKPYLPDTNVRLEEIDNFYKKAVKDVHPDVGGHGEALKRVNNAANILKNRMDEEKEYDIEGVKYPAYERNTTTRKNVNLKQKLNGNLSIQDCWEEGINKANGSNKDEYELVRYMKANDETAIGTFEGESIVSFAIEAEVEEDAAIFQTTYYIENHGEIENYKEAVFNKSLEELEENLQEIPMNATERASRVKSKLRF